VRFDLRVIFMALAVAALAATSGGAATVVFILDWGAHGPGTFDILAEASFGDNGGIASYGVVLTGPITSLDHKSPKSLAVQGPAGFGPAGFTVLRTPDDVTTLRASQDTITPTPHLIYGFGQEASSFAALRLNQS
jgi:hypothetical protein